MPKPKMTVLVVGATGSIGRLVVEEALRQGHAVRALVRTPEKARQLPREAHVVLGDVTHADTFLRGGGSRRHRVHSRLGRRRKSGGRERRLRRRAQRSAALGSRTARIALMTSIGVTNRTSSYNRTTEAHDWKRRSERLVRASGLPYTIVRPGWFDYNVPTSTDLSSCRAIHARPVIPAMASLRGARSPRSLCAASARITRCAKPSSSSRLRALRRTTSIRCSPPSMRIRKRPWTACATRQTNR